MANPMTPTQILSQLDKWNVTVHTPFSDWKTHNRDDETSKAFGPVNGFIWHHTGSDSTSASFLHNGTSPLPGPLVQLSIDASGDVNMIGWGRCNHAGGGDNAVLQHVINEDYTGQLVTHYGEGDAGAIDGNDHFYGVEIVYSGSHAMSPDQYETALRVSCAIIEHHGWSAKSVIGHYEWNRQKWDPGYSSGVHMNMANVRDDIQAKLDAGADMALTAAEIDAIATACAEKVWIADVIPAAVPPVANEDYATNPAWSARYAIHAAVMAGRRAQANTEAIETAVTDPAGFLAKLQEFFSKIRITSS